ncbi:MULTISPECIES: SMI1/KNR4 family protein [Paenibacillus]|uniref:SMI1/KNR4 family protein n=1 Tax=Paenibacillus TaxID=44249 RepID=UPI0011A5AB63|nr:SMI1/KNR4 family protein [Paenibacillus sp. IHBB 10380]
MEVKEFINLFNEKYPEVDRFELRNDRDISVLEEKLGEKLPFSLCTFLSEFSNGIFLLDIEPIGGANKESPCGELCKTKIILPDLPDQILIRETGELINSNRLISLTMFDASQNSNDHWVFICEEGIPNNEYRLGFISQSTHIIVKTLPNFEEWLKLFWNLDNNEMNVPVFHAFYPTFDERFKVLSS